MRRAVIAADGRLDLGDQAQLAGFTPGRLVDVRVSSSGSLHVSLADDSQVIDLDVSKLPAGKARLAVFRALTVKTRTGAGGVVFKRCPVCRREVLSAFRGDVTAVGKGEISKVERNGDIVGKCECGKAVVWERTPAR